jgi:hypothetical protein
MIFLYILAAIIAAFFLTALLVKKDFSLEKQIVINKTQKEVFDYLKMIRNQEKYSVWVMRDPKINLVYSGTDGTVGFKSAWTSNDKNTGIGEQEIIKLTEGISTEVEIRFKKPFRSHQLGEDDSDRGERTRDPGAPTILWTQQVSHEYHEPLYG